MWVMHLKMGVLLMFKDFLKAYRAQIILTMLPLGIFALLFWIFSIDWMIFGVAVLITLTVLIIYLMNRYLFFKQEISKAARIKDLETDLAQEKAHFRSYQKEIEEYFLLWVHQIKSPITAAYLLLDNKEEDTSSQQYQEIMKIENYTNMALNYLKVMTPSTDMNFSPVILDDLIRPLIKKYRVQFIQHHVRLNYDKISDTVLTDPNLTEIIVEQLLNNALKYAKGESITIRFVPDKQQLLIIDTGIGIKAEDLPRIFDKGYSSFSGQYNQKSSGIGLYLVKKISERLSQGIAVSSTYGKGTCFTITFHDDTDHDIE